MTLSVTDTAGNAFVTHETITVGPAGSLAAESLDWGFATVDGKVTVAALTLNHALVGSSVQIACKGGGCPKNRTIAVKAPKCKKGRKGKKGQKCKAPTTVTVNLTSAFAHHQLARSAHLTIRGVKSLYTGKEWIFSLTNDNNPAEGCLAPGSTKLGAC
jgi:hypothetical protein